MSEELVTPITPAAPVDPAPTPAVDPAVTVDPATTPTAPEPPSAEGAEPKVVTELKSVRKRAQKAEAEAAYYKGLAEGRGTQAAPAVQTPQPAAIPVEPKLEDCATYDEFDKANRSYTIELAKHELRQELARQKEQEKIVSQQTTFATRIQAAIEKDPQIAEIINDTTMPVSKPMAEVIQSSENAPELLKWLDANRTDARRISGLSPVLAARELALIEARFQAAPTPAPPTVVSRAPEPIATVSSVGASAIDEDTLPMTEWIARERERERQKRAAGRR